MQGQFGTKGTRCEPRLLFFFPMIKTGREDKPLAASERTHGEDFEDESAGRDGKGAEDGVLEDEEVGHSSFSFRRTAKHKHKR